MNPQIAHPAVRRLTLGNLELMSVGDRGYEVDGGAFFNVVPKTLWNATPIADERNRIWCGLNSLIVRGNGTTVLIETGCGGKLDEKQMLNWGVDPRRDYLERLAAAGVAPETVDVVINTHLHYDHTGWNTVRGRDGRVGAAFPRARYYTQRAEVEHARRRHPRDAVSFLTENYEPLLESGQMQVLNTPVGQEQEISPGVTVLPIPGHTRGMQAVVIRSGGQTACYISDLLPTRWHLKPSWILSFDLFPLETVENKQTFLERAARENWLVAFTHDPDWPWARVEAKGRSWAWKPEPTTRETA
ncbi:MAG: MBL fold metallo-hydrolase [Terriglobales bacterium]